MKKSALKILFLAIACIFNVQPLSGQSSGHRQIFEWDGSKYIPFTGARNRYRVYWNGLEWVALPTIEVEEKILQKYNNCINEKISSMRTENGVNLLRAACDFLSKGEDRDRPEGGDRDWLIGHCALSKLTGHEPPGAPRVIVSLCEEQAKNPSVKQKIELCALRGRC
jgi:hypothetical protein